MRTAAGHQSSNAGALGAEWRNPILSDWTKGDVLAIRRDRVDQRPPSSVGVESENAIAPAVKMRANPQEAQVEDLLQNGRT